MRDLAELIKDGWKIRLYPAGPTLAELKFRLTTKVPRGRASITTYADNAARGRALDQRVAELVAQGWVDTGVGHMPGARKRKGAGARAEGDQDTSAAKAAALEDAFGALVERTLAALGKARTDGEDAAIWRTAIAAYGRLKRRAGGDATENLVHFFAVDGIALDRRHPVVVQRARATEPRKARWLQRLEAAR